MKQFTDFSKLRKAIKSIGVDNFEGKLLKKLKLGKLEGNTHDMENLVLGAYGIYHLEKGTLAKVILHITDKAKRWLGQNALELLHNEQYDAPNLVNDLHKYHFTQCTTIESMFRRGNKKRYYMAQRVDGTFCYSIIDDNRVVYKSENQTLYVCRNCLDTLSSLTVKNYQVGSFKPQEIFDAPVSPLIGTGFDLECHAVPNIYTRDWREIAQKAKEQVNWQCEQCALNLSEGRRYLHCHHIDSNRVNNRSSNLRVLCVGCHANEPGHQHIKNSADYQNFVAQYNQP